MQALKPISVRPSYPQRGPQHMQRAAWAAVKAAIGGPGQDPVAAARHLFGVDDGVVPAAILRAAVAGARTDTPTWAQELVGTAVADWLGGLQPASAASALMARSVTIPLPDDFTIISVPYTASLPLGGYVAEGAPIPTKTAPLTPATLTPRKCGFGLVLSKELAKIGGEAVMRQLLTESAALTMDALVFSTTAPGLLAGVSATAASPAGPMGDLVVLGKAVSGAGSSGSPVFIAGTEAAAQLGVRDDHNAVVLPSGGIPPSRLIAVDPRAIVFGAYPAPEIMASEEATWHMSDTPEQIGAPGPVVASPTYSMFQTGNIALRLLLTLAFAKRSATAVAYSDVAWTAP